MKLKTEMVENDRHVYVPIPNGHLIQEMDFDSEPPMVFQNQVGYLDGRVNPHKPVEEHGEEFNGPDSIASCTSVAFDVESRHGPLRQGVPHKPLEVGEGVDLHVVVFAGNPDHFEIWWKC